MATIKFKDSETGKWTCVNANGAEGKNGKDGKDGKSAYVYAVEAGYSGSEDDFGKMLASREGEHYVTAKGAVGDGVTDDTEAFKRALAEHRTVFVPGGTYLLSDTITIGANSELELSQDTVLQFTQTDKSCITMLRLASLKGNHATILVPYTFGASVINADGGEDYAALDPDDIGGSNNIAVPPFTRWDPQWKMSRYVTDINICKPDDRGFMYSKDGECYGTAVYIHCDIADYPLSYMWGVHMSGLRIAGGFNHGIHIKNIGDTETCWNHDMRIEGVVDACKVGVLVENCRYARLAVTVQPRKAYSDSGVYKAYAENGIKLVDSRGVDLGSSRVWDWNDDKTLWAAENEYQHIALYGECRGLILDDFLYNENASVDIRSLIYTDKTSNLTQMSILQEPIDRWFKVQEGEPFYNDGISQRRLALAEHLEAHFDTDIVKGFTDVLAGATDYDGSIYNGVGYKMGYRWSEGSAEIASSYYGCTGFIPIKIGSKLYAKDLSLAEGDDNCKVVFYDADKNVLVHANRAGLIPGNNWYATYIETEDGFSIEPNNVVAMQGVAYARFTFYKSAIGSMPMMALDEEIKYASEGFLADGVKVRAKNVVSDLSASVGQTIVVKSVDENGKPTEWEAVDNVSVLGVIVNSTTGTYSNGLTFKDVYSHALKSQPIYVLDNRNGFRYTDYRALDGEHMVIFYKVNFNDCTISLLTLSSYGMSFTITYRNPILASPNGTKFKITVDDSGTITATEVAE